MSNIEIVIVMLISLGIGLLLGFVLGLLTKNSRFKHYAQVAKEFNEMVEESHER